MPRITLKETITKKIEISMDSLNELVDNLTEEERAMLLARLQKTNTVSLKTFKKNKLESILADFAKTELYEDGFLKDLEDGLRKSSIYK